jgi:hypothetical protein
LQPEYLVHLGGQAGIARTIKGRIWISTCADVHHPTTAEDSARAWKILEKSSSLGVYTKLLRIPCKHRIGDCHPSDGGIQYEVGQSHGVGALNGCHRVLACRLLDEETQ